MSADLLDVALSHARAGLRVFPLQPGKKVPREGSRGVLAATTDLAQVEAWWRAVPALNVGVACGDYGQGWHLLVVDVDVKSGGMDSYTRLVEEHGETGGFGKTYTVQTPGGGWHHYYWSDRPVKNSASLVAAGIDTRGQGGYVVSAGSVTEAGEYRVVGKDPIAIIKTGDNDE